MAPSAGVLPLQTMVSTLIVRDATLAINGAPEARGDARDHLRDRVEQVGAMDAETLAACAEVLRSSGSGENVDVDVLEAMTILGLAQPAEAERFGLSPLAAGRRLAARLEQSGDPDFAMAVLEILLEAFPHQSALERDLSALMRRQGMVHDLINRYEDRAKRLLREGKTQEAIGWLREVLLLDGSRKDVARLIRNLRLKQTAGRRGHSTVWRKILVILLVSLGTTFLVLREQRLRTEFQSMTPAVAGNLQSMSKRLALLEAFLDANPIWHGSLFVISERTGLRGDIDRLEREEALKVQAAEAQLLEQIESADLLHAKARAKVDVGDFAAALEALKAARELAPAGWEGSASLENDIQAISEYLEDGQ